MTLLRSSVPLKWQKYLTLVKFGFVTLEKLQTDIRRYPRSEVGSLVRALRADMPVSGGNQHKNLYVVKLVSRDLQGQLPNYRVENRRDIERIERFARGYDDRYVEVWFCKTRIDQNVFSVAGRIVFSAGDSSRSQTIEQLWRCSPRLIEKLSKNLPYAYARLSRYGWAWRYDIEEVQIPDSAKLLRNELDNDLRYSLSLIERERERLEIFLSFLDEFSFNAYSIEYKIVGSRLEIIDWDTPNDKRVLIH